MTNTGLSDVFGFTTFLRASSLGMFLALSMAALMMLLLYYLDSNISFNSLNLFSLVSVIEQILTILKARLYGILLHTLAG